MNNLKSRSKSSLFLMELIIVIMFFTISAAICMEIFANAKVKNDYSRNVANAAFKAESIAEVYKNENGDLDKLSQKYKGTKTSDGVLEIYYDIDWKKSDRKNAAFTARVTETEEPDIEKAFIEIFKENTGKQKDNKEENIFEIVSTVIPAKEGA